MNSKTPPKSPENENSKAYLILPDIALERYGSQASEKSHAIYFPSPLLISYLSYTHPVTFHAALLG